MRRVSGGSRTSPIARTRSGDVRGEVVDGIFSFKGIPYAAPPFGGNRLLPPQPVEPWTGVRDALAYGPKFPQPPYPPPIDVLLPELAGSGEDCLTLNVWSADPGPARRPVMVWIPGGMFEYHGTGASPWYDGSRFARDGVVCVTINYRVAADGFLDLGGGNANRGILDQIAALEWVQENIAAFGGDPDNVTVFGESAGALSVGTLLAMPRATGLFHRAIAQSGAAHHAISTDTARRVAGLFAAALGVEPTREAMAAVPLDRFLAAQAHLRADLTAHPDPERWGAEVVTAMLPWQPVIDGDAIPGRPLDRIAGGAGANVDLIVGTNLDEHRMFLVAGDVIDRVSPEALAGAIAGYGMRVEPTLAAYRAHYPHASPGDLLAAVQTDWYWRVPAIRLADAHASGSAATYMYEFAWRSPQFDGRLGACHALEIAFVFDTLGNATEPLMGPAPPQPLADAMHAAWVGFAANGECGWPKYDLTRRATMRFDTTSRVIADPRSAERALWAGVR
jgi:carboxylesterase type B